MYALGPAGAGDVGARVYEESSFQFMVLSSQLDGFAGESFELVRGQVFLAQLDEVHPATKCLRNGFEQPNPARVFISGKLRAIGDVVEQQGQSSVTSRQSSGSLADD